MKINFKNTIAFILLILCQFSFSQKKDENIGTEVVNVVKPYSPTISDANKVRETPSSDEDETNKKETIKYNIFSFPVASTFAPSKGKAETVDKEKQLYLYNNYATVGVGNYGTFIGELFVNQQLGTNDYVGGMFRHLSSQGGINGVDLKNSYYDTAIDLTYGYRGSDLSYNFDLGYQNQLYNWYGLPINFGNTLPLNDKYNLIGSINPQQIYNNFYLGGRLDVNEGALENLTLKYNHFADDYGSAENRFYVKPALSFDVNNVTVKTNLIVDYLKGNFKNDYSKTNPIEYGFTNFGIAPSFAMQEEDWSFNFGVKVFYSMDNKNSNSRFLIYPNINGSYKVVGDLMIFYTGVEGNLEQNTYSDFVSVNPYLSPTLNITPTDKQFDIYAGLKGKLASTVGYNVRASYTNERDKALFKNNDYNEAISNENYGFGNSMQVVYDDVKTASIFGELKADITDDVSFGIDATFSSYNKKDESEAWNLPTLKLSAKTEFNITPKWYAGVNVFYVGERKDKQFNTDLMSVPLTVTLKDYFDLNAHVGFKYNDRLTAFMRANNITNQDYQKWLNYQVQGLQIVLGVNYKFDF